MTTPQEWAREVFLTFEAPGPADDWNAIFLRLVAKSDPEHKVALGRAFPDGVQAYQEWVATTDPWDFYRRYHVGNIPNGDAKKFWDARVGV